MTERQMVLIDAEISRHIAMAKICERPLKDDHIELANVLTDVLRAVRENNEKKAR